MDINKIMKYDDLSEINPTTDIDRALITTMEIAATLSVIVISLFAMYILGGALLLRMGSMTLPYMFLSVSSDPVFNILSTISGITIGTGCLALMFFALISKKNDTNVGVVVFFAIVGIGFAAGVVRMSIAVTLRFLFQIIP
jgi:hypothetical protein